MQHPVTVTGLRGDSSPRWLWAAGRTVPARLASLLLLLLTWLSHAPVQAQAYYSPQAREHLAQAMGQLQALADAGGWPAVPDGPMLEPGDQDPRIALVRQRLRIGGDHPGEVQAPGAQNRYDPALADSVRVFQRRHGVLPDARIGPDTVLALNVPALERVAQLRRALERSEALATLVASRPAPRRVLVNIAAQELVAIEGTRTALHSAVIVGRTDRQTPELHSTIRSVTFHPSWTVPDSIVRNDLHWRLADDAEYFERRGFRVIRVADGREVSPGDVVAQRLGPGAVRLVQAPGPRNPLGRIRIDMPNAQAIYLHDTPDTRRFTFPEVFLSSGCVRVARIVELAAWLLAEQGQTLDWVGTQLRQAKTNKVALAVPVPVHLVYLPAWADEHGIIYFYPDVYGLDTASSRPPRS